MSITALVIWLVIGGVAGFLAGSMMGATRPWGIPGDVFLGIIGSIFGGWMLGLMNLGSGGMIGSFITALIGAIALIWIVRKVAA